MGCEFSVRRFVFSFCILLVTAVPARTDESPVYRGRTVEQWTGDLAHFNRAARAAAAKALLLLRPKSDESLRSLLVALEDRNAEVRLYAAYALGKIERRPSDCLGPLTRLLKDPNEHVRYSAEWALARIAKSVADQELEMEAAKQVAELLTEAETAMTRDPVRRDHLDIVQRARESLLAALVPADPPPPAVEPVIELAQPVVQPTEPSFLAGLRSPQQRLSVLASLEQPAQLIRVWEGVDDPFLRWCASHVLVRFGEGAIPDLINALRHDDARVQLQAVQCLAEMGPVAASSLSELLELPELLAELLEFPELELLVELLELPQLELLAEINKDF